MICLVAAPISNMNVSGGTTRSYACAYVNRLPRNNEIIARPKKYSPVVINKLISEEFKIPHLKITRETK